MNTLVKVMVIVRCPGHAVRKEDQDDLSLLLLLFAMIRSVVKSFKVPDVDVVAAWMSHITDSTPKTLVRLDAGPGWMSLTPICQMKDLLLGGSTTCRPNQEADKEKGSSPTSAR